MTSDTVKNTNEAPVQQEKPAASYSALSGNEAVAQAMRQIEPVVVAAYPITPQTDIVQNFSAFVADGLVRTEFILVESEHSAMSAVVGAAASGVRAMTATASNGLALMYEVLHITSGLRLPVVMPVVARALSAPINIHCDHSDFFGVRDAGWIQLMSEDAQEAYDNTLQAVLISEDPDVLLPVMVGLDGFVTSHSIENVALLKDSVVKDFLGEHRPHTNLLDPENPITVGPLALQDSYFEFKRQQAEGLRSAARVIDKVAERFEGVSGRRYRRIETFNTDDAEAIIITCGSTAGTARYALQRLRQKGLKVGLIKVRCITPFPAHEVRQAVAGARSVAVLDRSMETVTEGGPLFVSVAAALAASGGKPPIMRSYIYGLGGRDIHLSHLDEVYRSLLDTSTDRQPADVSPQVEFLGTH